MRSNQDDRGFLLEGSTNRGVGDVNPRIFFGFWNSSPIEVTVPSDPNDEVSRFFLWEKCGLHVVEASQTVAEGYEKSA